MFNERNSKILILLTFILIILGCSNEDDNLMGNNGPDITDSLQVKTFDIMKSSFIFTDSIETISSNDHLLVGSSEDINSFSLMKFYNFPDSLTEENVNDTITLSLPIISNSLTNDKEIKLGKISQEWSEAETTWENCKDDETWTVHPTELDTILATVSVDTEEDTLRINIPKDIILNWQNEPENNHGFAIFTENENYIDFYSEDSDFKPSLKFNYQDTLIYKENPSISVFATSNYELSVNEDEFIIGNLPKTSTSIELYDITPDSLGVSDENFPYTIINRAELIVEVDQNSENYNCPDSVLYVYPYLINEEINFENIEAVENDNILNFPSIVGDKLDFTENTTQTIVVTPLIQAIVAGDYANNGIVLKPRYGGIDFDYLKFNIENVKLKVYYTTVNE